MYLSVYLSIYGIDETLTEGDLRMYKCICGKEFEKVQSLHGHQSHCKINLGDRYSNYQKSSKMKSDKMLKSKQSIAIQREISKANEWREQRNRCEVCGKIMEVKYGSGRFCSKSCRLSYCATANNDKRKANISKSCIKAVEEGRMVPTNCNPRGNYVERYWKFILSSVYNLKVLPQVRIQKPSISGHNGYYFMDLLVNDKYDLEIDGPYHNEEHDKERDKIISSKGYIVYRVPYINPRRYRDKVLCQVSEFVESIKMTST